MSRADKMYKDSPKIVKDDGGKATFTRGEKKTAEVNAGTAGIAKEGDAPEVQNAVKEALYDKDLSAIEEIVKRMKKDRSEVGSGEENIDKIESNSKE